MNDSAHAQEKEGPVCGFDKANWLNIMLISWVTPLLAIGAKRPLLTADTDRFGMYRDGDVPLVASQFRKHWEIESARVVRPMCGSSVSAYRGPTFRALYAAFATRLFPLSGFTQLLSRASLLTLPWLLRQYVVFLKSNDSEGWGLFWVALLVVASLLSSLLNNLSFSQAFQLGTSVRRCACVLVDDLL